MRLEQFYSQAISDAHAGMDTPRFDVDKCRERIESLPRMGDERRRLKTYAGIWFDLDGDMIDGEAIYPGQAWDQSVSTRKQLAVVGQALRNMLLDAHARAPRVPITLTSTPGNHGRHGSPEADPESNYDAILADQLEEWAKDKGWLTVRASASFFHSWKVGKWTVLATHRGYKHAETKANTDPIKTHLHHYGAHLFLQSHHHRAAYADLGDGWSWACNGSICGWTAYSQAQCAAYTAPQQLWFVSGPRHVCEEVGWHTWA